MPRIPTSGNDVMKAVERAYYYYIDNLKSKGLRCPVNSLNAFAMVFLPHVSAEQFTPSALDNLLQQHQRHVSTVPVYGCILLDAAMRNVACIYAVQQWAFPRGKLEPGEDPLVCAAREVSEETGYDCTPLINPSESVSYKSKTGNKSVTLYVVVGADRDKVLKTFTRSYEAAKLKWFPVDKVPCHDHHIRAPLEQLRLWALDKAKLSAAAVSAGASAGSLAPLGVSADVSTDSLAGLYPHDIYDVRGSSGGSVANQQHNGGGGFHAITVDGVPVTALYQRNAAALAESISTALNADPTAANTNNNSNNNGSGSNGNISSSSNKGRGGAGVGADRSPATRTPPVQRSNSGYNNSVVETLSAHDAMTFGLAEGSLQSYSTDQMFADAAVLAAESAASDNNKYFYANTDIDTNSNSNSGAGAGSMVIGPNGQYTVQLKPKPAAHANVAARSIAVQLMQQQAAHCHSGPRPTARGIMNAFAKLRDNAASLTVDAEAVAAAVNAPQNATVPNASSVSGAADSAAVTEARAAIAAALALAGRYAVTGMRRGFSARLDAARSKVATLKEMLATAQNEVAAAEAAAEAFALIATTAASSSIDNNSSSNSNNNATAPETETVPVSEGVSGTHKGTPGADACVQVVRVLAGLSESDLTRIVETFTIATQSKSITGISGSSSGNGKCAAGGRRAGSGSSLKLKPAADAPAPASAPTGASDATGDADAVDGESSSLSASQASQSSQSSEVSESQSNAHSQPHSQSQSLQSSQVLNESETKVEPETESKPDIEAKAEATAESKPEAETEIKAEPETESKAETNAESNAKADTEATQSETTETKPETKPEAESTEVKPSASDTAEPAQTESADAKVDPKPTKSEAGDAKVEADAKAESDSEAENESTMTSAVDTAVSAFFATLFKLNISIDTITTNNTNNNSNTVSSSTDTAEKEKIGHVTDKVMMLMPRGTAVTPGDANSIQIAAALLERRIAKVTKPFSMSWELIQASTPSDTLINLQTAVDDALAAFAASQSQLRHAAALALASKRNKGPTSTGGAAGLTVTGSNPPRHSPCASPLAGPATATASATTTALALAASPSAASPVYASTVAAAPVVNPNGTVSMGSGFVRLAPANVSPGTSVNSSAATAAAGAIAPAAVSSAVSVDLLAEMFPAAASSNSSHGARSSGAMAPNRASASASASSGVSSGIVFTGSLAAQAPTAAMSMDSSNILNDIFAVGGSSESAHDAAMMMPLDPAVAAYADQQHHQMLGYAPSLTLAAASVSAPAGAPAAGVAVVPGAVPAPTPAKAAANAKLKMLKMLAKGAN